MANMELNHKLQIANNKQYTIYNDQKHKTTQVFWSFGIGFWNLFVNEHLTVWLP